MNTKARFLSLFVNEPTQHEDGTHKSTSWLASLRAKYPIVVFSKSYCPFCTKLKRLLFDKLTISKDAVFWMDHDLQHDELKIDSLLALETKQTSVPNVFIGQAHVGGCDATFALFRSGELYTRLRALNVAFTEWKEILFSGVRLAGSGAAPTRSYRWYLQEKLHGPKLSFRVLDGKVVFSSDAIALSTNETKHGPNAEWNPGYTYHARIGPDAQLSIYDIQDDFGSFLPPNTLLRECNRLQFRLATIVYQNQDSDHVEPSNATIDALLLDANLGKLQSCFGKSIIIKELICKDA